MISKNNETVTRLQKSLIDLRIQNLDLAPKAPIITRMELMGSQRMFGKVQKKEDLRYTKNISKQKKDLSDRRIKINQFLTNLEDEKSRRASLLADYNASFYSISESSVPTPQPVFGALPTFQIQPIKKFPVRAITKQKLRMSRAEASRINRLRAIASQRRNN